VLPGPDSGSKVCEALDREIGKPPVEQLCWSDAYDPKQLQQERPTHPIESVPEAVAHPPQSDRIFANTS
jgi:hypothetical protein